MRTSDFYYELPQELIAQDPLEDRSSSRLMHLSMADGSIEHRHFRDILDYLNEGDTLVINDTKVIPARLYGHKEETGAVIEILLLKRRENDIWECLVKPGKKARPGAKITFGDGILKGEILRIPAAEGLKIPHMGWNNIRFPNKGRLFAGVPEDAYVYFVHSYYLKAQDEKIVTATTEYGTHIHASVESGNLFACQFHPEKSSHVGLQILKNFAKLEGKGGR
jgi:hypothetical protein